MSEPSHSLEGGMDTAQTDEGATFEQQSEELDHAGGDTGATTDDPGSASPSPSPLHEDSHRRPVEVFVGGLPQDVDEATLHAVFSEAGEIVDVQVRRNRFRGVTKAASGTAYVWFKEPEGAEAATQQIKKVNGTPVGVHLSKSRLPDEVDKLDGVPALHVPEDSTHTVSILIQALRKQLHKQSAVALALKELYAEREAAAPSASGGHAAGHGGAAANASAAAGAAQQSGTPQAPLADATNYLDNFPLCNQLIQRFTELKTPKTPMSILHEYATRTSMQITYDETAESNLGPFQMDAKLMDPDANIHYTGSGKAKTKKDAKQIAAAAVLEQLLKSLPQSVFLGSNKTTKKPPTKLAHGLGYEEVRGGGGGGGMMGGRRGGFRGGLGGRTGGNVPIKFVRGSEPGGSQSHFGHKLELNAPFQQPMASQLASHYRPRPAHGLAAQQSGEVLGHKRSFSAAMNEAALMDATRLGGQQHAGHPQQRHHDAYGGAVQAAAAVPQVKSLAEYRQEQQGGGSYYAAAPMQQQHTQAAYHTHQQHLGAAEHGGGMMFLDHGGQEVMNPLGAYHHAAEQQPAYHHSMSHAHAAHMHGSAAQQHAGMYDRSAHAQLHGYGAQQHY